MRQDLLRKTKLKKLFDKVLFPNMLFVIEATNTIQHIFVFIAAQQILSSTTEHCVSEPQRHWKGADCKTSPLSKNGFISLAFVSEGIYGNLSAFISA